MTPALGWQRDSRTAAGRRDGSQPRWWLECSGGIQPGRLPVALLLLGDFLHFFFRIIIILKGRVRRGG